MLEEKIVKAVSILKSGGVVIFPTDTVWGIGASLNSPQGIEKLYKIKKREKNKPTAVLVSDIKMAHSLAEINKQAQELINKYWPGGLTIIVKERGSQNTIGLRQPNHELALKLIRELGTGLVASSANFSGQNPPLKKDQLNKQLINLADFVLDGESGGKPASTVVDTTKNPFVILRTGLVKLS